MIKIGIVGLGYVGLPLARLLATQYYVIGFDIDRKRISELQQGEDKTGEVDNKEILSVLDTDNLHSGLSFTSDVNELQEANFYIITVPTPIDAFSRPDLIPLENASTMIGKLLQPGDYVVYESTVYPGVTEEVCVPILEQQSGLTLNKDFYVGYSPERINPGDKERTVDKILKVTSGSTPEAAIYIDNVYRSVITAGTYKASSIKVAESAKVIENAQRDVNIAFVNELAKIFTVLGIDTNDVLEAASTKWNFLPFKPGLVGGHCIGVDPFYLAEKAKIHGYNPELILASRRLNDSMGGFVAEQVIKAMIKNDIAVKNSHILILGLAFKENCHDVRNSKILDIYDCLKDYDCKVDICDTWVDEQLVEKEYGIQVLTSLPKEKKYDAIILGVAHSVFLDMDLQLLKKEKALVYDVKSVLGARADYRL